MIRANRFARIALRIARATKLVTKEKVAKRSVRMVRVACKIERQIALHKSLLFQFQVKFWNCQKGVENMGGVSKWELSVIKRYIVHKYFIFGLFGASFSSPNSTFSTNGTFCVKNA